jgi:uncharacterized protein YjbJ (UPF0337 family)
LDHNPNSTESLGRKRNGAAKAADLKGMEHARTCRSTSYWKGAPRLVPQFHVPLISIGKIMFGHSAKKSKAKFGVGILTTFGKISQSDIDKIDGRSERLIAELTDQYGWSENFARQKAEAFELKLAMGTTENLSNVPAGVGS